MAVVITSKFYQESEWKDISKIVFTSPNMDSPAIAGTRSHILPGEGNLGTWYEDTSEMFRIEDHQFTTESDFYNYRMVAKEDTDLQVGAGYIDVKRVNYSGFDTYVKENTGVEIIGYSDGTGFIVDRKTKLEYTPHQKNLNEIHSRVDKKVTEITLIEKATCTDGFSTSVGVLREESYARNYGWYTQVISEFSQCHITFEFEDTTKITAVEMSSVEFEFIERTWDFAPTDSCYDIGVPDGEAVTNKVYFIGNYTIQGSIDDISWTTIYTGSNTTNLSKFIYLSNNQYYKYYRLNITNNSSLSSGVFDTSFYGVRKLRFYNYEFSTDAGNESIALYEFNNLDAPKVVRISNAYPQEAAIPTVTNESTDNNVEGAMMLRHTTVSGEPVSSSYSVSLSSYVDPYDYMITAVCVSSTVSGLGEDSVGQTYAKQDKINVVVDAALEFMDVGLDSEYVLFTAQGSAVVQVDTANWVGEDTITYTTIASGTVTSGTQTYPLTGYTTRYVESSLYARRENFRLVIDEYITNSGIVAENEPLYVWGYNDRFLDLDVKNAVVFEVTTGEAYNCRLTAWDDVTHSTTINELIQGDHVRCSAMTYCCNDSKLNPTESKSPLNLVYPPVHNRIFKGNVEIGGNRYYYGDFDLVYRYQSDVYGDYLIFKPMLYNITTDISYGIHDYIITLHYSYT